MPLNKFFIKILSVLFLCVIFTKLIYPQDSNINNSLFRKFKFARYDTSKINLLTNIADASESSNPDTALYFYNMALLLANQTGNQTYIASCLRKIGAFYIEQSAYNNAIEYLFKSLKLFEKINNKEGVSKCYINIGTIHAKQGNFNKSIEYYLKSLKIAEEIGNKKEISYCYNNIGNIYYESNKYDKAIEYYSKSLKIFEEIKDEKNMSYAILNIANIYRLKKNYDNALDLLSNSLKIFEKLNSKNEIALFYKEIGLTHNEQGKSNTDKTVSYNKYIKASEYISQSLKICKEINNKSGIISCFVNLSLVNANIAASASKKTTTIIMYNKAIDYCITASNIAREIGYYNDMIISYNCIASYYVNLGKCNQAVDYLNKSLNISKEIGSLLLQREIYKQLSEVYDSIGVYEKAYGYQTLFIKINDSIFNQQKSKQIADMQIKYETGRKEQELLVKEKELEIQNLTISRMNYYIIALAIIVLLIILTAYYIIRRNKYRALLKNKRLEQKLLQSQMNPHFIFNSLSVIQSIIYKNKSELAVKYLSKFAKLTRMILENSRVEYIALEKEISMLEIYLDLQSIRFENKFNYTIETDNSISPELIEIPPMLAQPFIENSIEHGIMLKKSTGNIKVVFRKTKKDILAFEVSDDGIGREKSKKLKEFRGTEEKKHISLATAITKERLENINKSLKKKITLDIIDLKDENNNAAGTKVTFFVPFKTI